MENQSRRCMGCMAPMEGEGEICSVCGHDNSIDNPAGCLRAGTLLGQQYLAGVSLRQNDLTTLYLGYDLKKDKRVYIEEFFPRQFAYRAEDGRTPAVSPKNQARYKTLLSDMADRWKRMAKSESRAIFRIKDRFQEGNVLFCVTSYQPYITLDEYLEQRGPLAWSEVRPLVLPVLSLVSQMHNAGLTHGGISPDNVVLDKKGTLRLMGLSLPELRTAGTDLPPELYAGYSAPEQYSKNLWQGEWTDIYSLGCLLYRMLSGGDPPSAPVRERGEDAAAVLRKDPGIPENVAAAVKKAMELQKQDRFVSVDQFTAALLEETASNTAVFRPKTGPDAAEEALPEHPAKDAPAKKSRLTAVLGLGSALGVILLILVLAGVQNPFYTEPPPPEETPVMEQQLIGMYYEQMEPDSAAYEGLTITAEYEYNELVPAGVIFEQSPALGEALPESGEVRVRVSSGSRFVVMPNLEGCSERYALEQLDKLGLTWERRESAEIAVPVGAVVCDTPPGTKMAVGDKVILTVRVETVS